ncbi:hypothetical protein ACFLQU_04360, partial [Verrucomicrobiota bacterium]
MKKLSIRKSVIMAFACMLGCGAWAQSVDIGNCNVELYLSDAVSHDGEQRGGLMLELQIRDGKWRKDFVRGRGMGQGRHVGVLTSVKEENGTAVLSADVKVKRDLWLRGGMGAYEIRVDPLPDKTGFSGSFKGQYSLLSEPKPIAPRRKTMKKPAVVRTDIPPGLMKMLKQPKPEAKPGSSSAARKIRVLDTMDVKGKVTGRLLPPWPEQVKGHVPVKPGEHPRLIFRKADVPALR